MLDIDLWTVLWTGINLVILYLLMRRFLFKPVTAVMEQRAQAIQEGLDQAEKARQAMEEIQSEKESQLAKARSQADQIVGQARAQGQQEYARILSSAQSDARAIRESAQSQIEAERRQMVQDTRQQMAALALLAAARVSGKVLDEDSDRAMVEDFLNEAGDP